MLLRVVLGFTAIAQGSLYFTNSRSSSSGFLALGCLLVAAGLGVLIGFLTPVAGVLLVLMAAGVAVRFLPLPDPSLIDPGLPAVLMVGVAAAITLTGPGALSVDGRMFGRREIVIPPMPRSQPPES